MPLPNGRPVSARSRRARRQGPEKSSNSRLRTQSMMCSTPGRQGTVGGVMCPTFSASHPASPAQFDHHQTSTYSHLSLSFPQDPQTTISTRRTQPKELDVTTGTSFPSRKYANGVVDGVFVTKSDSRNPRQLGEYPGQTHGQPRHPCGRAYPGPTGPGMGRWPGDRRVECSIASAAEERGTDSGNCSVAYIQPSIFYLIQTIFCQVLLVCLSSR